VDIDGNKVITRDRQWGGPRHEVAFAKAKITGKVAKLENYAKLPGRKVNTLFIDEHENVVVSSTNAWSYPYLDKLGGTLDILSPQKKGPGFDLHSQTPLESWMSFIGVSQHRVFFNVRGGKLVANIDDPKKPVAQAFFQAYRTPVVHGNDILAAGGRLGVFQLDKSVSNLVMAD
jgi:hypothetical protein